MRMMVNLLSRADMKVTSWEHEGKTKTSKTVGWVCTVGASGAFHMLLGQVTCTGTTSRMSRTLQRRSAKDAQKEKQRDARLLSCVKPTRVNPCFGREKQPASAAGRDEPSCRQRPRKRRSERCDKHLDHMTLTTRLPWHVSVDFCHAQTCTQCSAALRDATAFLFFFFKAKASSKSVSYVPVTFFYCSPLSITWTRLS